MATTRSRNMTVTFKEMFFRTVAMLVISAEVCRSSDTPKSSYGPPPSNDNSNQKNNNNYYEPEFQRPLAVFTERPVNVAGFVLIPVVQVPSSDLRVIYRPQIDSVSKTEPIVMCKSSTKSFEATPAVQVSLQQPFYLYDERTLIPFPKTVTIVHGGYRMSIPVGVVVAPVPVGVLRSGPVFVTTLYAIPVGPLPTVPVRYVPWSAYPPISPAPQYLQAPSPPPEYTEPAPQQYSEPPQYPPSAPQYPPSAPQYPQSAPQYPPSAPQYPPAAPQYPPPQPTAPQYPPPQYSRPAPPSPLYYQQYGAGGDNADELRNRDPPGKLYSQLAAFQNSKESPVLSQLREESEKNRNKYGKPSPTYSSQYQTIDA